MERLSSHTVRLRCAVHTHGKHREDHCGNTFRPDAGRSGRRLGRRMTPRAAEPWSLHPGRPRRRVGRPKRSKYRSTLIGLAQHPQILPGPSTGVQPRGHDHMITSSHERNGGRARHRL